MGIIIFRESEEKKIITDDDPKDIRPVIAIGKVELYNVRPGCQIFILDSPDGSLTDDFTHIAVKKPSPQYTVHSLERTYEDDTVLVAYLRNNGMGKPGYVKIK
ncbi:hypothetical protein ECE50_012575 [Chitinophaga sp. Mgbs1]|uniref:Uncharacterized protein n=1 Tax=Chitinophaga solisilvae TaxID=1233460 RepID=A0A3S1D0Q7_9BACT|nr:hypothetical protein [Chitinophaga solisilvae]